MLECDGVIENLLPSWLENGVNTIFLDEIGIWSDNTAEYVVVVGDMEKTNLCKRNTQMITNVEHLKNMYLLVQGGNMQYEGMDK